MTTPAAHLKAKLGSLPFHDGLKLADRAGVPHGIALKAGRGEVVNAEAYLALCAACGIDPVTGDDRKADPRPIEVTWWLFAVAVKLHRIKVRLDNRAAAELAGVSIASISRAENAHPLSVKLFLVLCAYIGVHPNTYVTDRPKAQPAHRTELGNQARHT